MSNIQTATELLRKEVMKATDLPVSTRIPEQRVEDFVIIDAGVPVSKYTIAEITPVFIKVYSDDLEFCLAEIDKIRRHLWTARDGHFEAWEQDTGVHEGYDPDLPDTVIYQISGYVHQSVG